MSIIDRAITAISPSWAAKREYAKAQKAYAQKIQQVVNQGYGSHGASTTKKSMRTFNPLAGDTKSDIEENLDLLRSRSRDLYMGGALANGALKGIRTNTVGQGLKLKPNFDAEYLGLTTEQAARLRKQIFTEWSMWAESTNCDANGMNNFYELQQLAFLSMLQSGDVFALLPDIPRKFSAYDLRIRLVEADRCSNPTSSLRNDKISSGVEVDDDGMIVAYHFTSKHPFSLSTQPNKWTRVEVRGEQSGRVNVLHLLDIERPDQRRGVPILAPVIEALKQLERFTEAELTAAVIGAMFTVFITRKSPDTQLKDFSLDIQQGPPGATIPEPSPPLSDNELAMGPGAVNILEEGEDISIANPGRPNPQFDPFIVAILRQVGSSLEVPYELLIKHFSSSYSASRGALLEAWKMFKMRRAWLASRFCQPAYTEWFSEAVAKGRIDAPGYFADPAIAAAYTRAEWHGPSFGMLDPVKEVNAAVTRMENGLSTGQREAAELTGTEYEENVKQRALESRMWSDNGMTLPGSPAPVQTAEPDSTDDTEDDSAMEGGENNNAQNQD